MPDYKQQTTLIGASCKEPTLLARDAVIRGPNPLRQRSTKRTQKMSDKSCPNCGMEQSEWPNPVGFPHDGTTYCCEGCAKGTGCTC